MNYEVSVRAVGASPTAVVAQETTWAEFPRLWGKLLDEVWSFIRGGGAAKAGHNVMLYRDDVPNVEVGVQVAGSFPPAGRVVASELPAGRVASTVHRGDYGRLGEAHDAVVRWCLAEGHEVTRTRWEIYGDPREDDPAAPVAVEVCWLLR
ncbi:MAG TPA: GyrI-like domain-containing protein [Acidimicrobiales bacterium]|nr:GyrI-like domain-containing protein [Acidimicrobiales bacterium]